MLGMSMGINMVMANLGVYWKDAPEWATALVLAPCGKLAWLGVGKYAYVTDVNYTYVHGIFEKRSCQIIITREEAMKAANVSQVEYPIYRKSEGAKHDNGKPEFRLIPQHALEDVAKVMSYGAKKDAPDVQVEPVAYAVFADNGNIRIWGADPNQVETLRQQYGEALQPLYLHPRPAPEVALVGAFDAGQRSAQYQSLLEAVLREIPHRKWRRGNAPGHDHSVPGIWDSDNGALAGKECAWCKVWNDAVSAMEAPK